MVVWQHLITIKFTLEDNNRTRANTYYILVHGIEKAYGPPICLYHVHVKQCMTFLCILSMNKQLVLKILDRLQLASMDSRFSLKLLVHGTVYGAFRGRALTDTLLTNRQ